MAKGKKKKKKSSQTDCESSSVAKESHGTKSNQGEVSDITECTCLTQPQRRKRLLPCFARKETPPNCPIHSSKDSSVVQKPETRGKEKDTTNQPCLVRRIGRWIVKKVTKGKKEKEIPAEPLEPTSATVCINTGEPPRLQTLCQEVLNANGPERSTQAGTTTDNSAQPGSIEKTTDAHLNQETGRKMVTSLKELCKKVIDNTGSKTTYMYYNEQILANDKAQPTEQNVELDNDVCNHVTVMSLKEMCKVAMTYNDDLEHNIDDNESDDTAELDNTGKNYPELDTASISSSSDGGVLMTLIELCTKVVSTTDDKETTNTDEKDNEKDGELNTKDVNLECDAKIVRSLRDICSAVIAYANASTACVIDTKNIESATTAINGCKQELADEGTKSKESIDTKTKPSKDDMKPEHDQIRLMSLKDMCKGAVTYTDYLEYNIDDNETDHTNEHDDTGKNYPELDTASISSNSDGGMLMTLIELCTAVVSTADDKETTNINDKDNENDEELYRKDVNLECDAKKLRSLKDICTAVVTSINASTAGVIKTKNTEGKTNASYDSEQEFADEEKQSKEPTEKKTKPSKDDMKPDHDEITVTSLKDMCKSALTYHDNLKYTTGATKVHQLDTHEKLDTNDPELDKRSKSSTFHDSVLMTLSQLCAKVINNYNDKKTSYRDAKDNANKAKFYTKEEKREFDVTRLMSLKDICKAVIKTADAKKMGVIGAEKSPMDVAANCKNTMILSLKKDASDSTAKQIHKEEFCKSVDNQQNVNLQDKLKHVKNTSKSSKELCLMKLGNADDMRASNGGAQKEPMYETYQEKSHNKIHNVTVIKQGNTDTECDKNEAKSLKEFCTIAVRTNDTGDARVRTNDTYPKQDHVQDGDDKAHNETYDYDPNYLDVSPKCVAALEPSLQKMCYSANGNELDVKTDIKDMEEDYESVKVANDMAENNETDQQSAENKSKFLCDRDVRSAASKTHEDENTKISEVNLTNYKMQDKSKESGNVNQDIKSQSYLSVHSQVKLCREQFKIAGKFYERIRERRDFTAGIKPGDDMSKATFPKKRWKAKYAGDQKIRIRYTKSDQVIGRQFKLEEDLNQIIIENSKAIAITLKELTNANKDSVNEFKTGRGYEDNIKPIYDKTELESLTQGRPINEIILENDKAIAMTLKELSSTAVGNADRMQTKTCDTKQNQVNNTNKLNKLESKTFDLFSGYIPNSAMSLKDMYLKAMKKTDGVKEDISNIEGDQTSDKVRDGAHGFRPSFNSFSDMTDYMKKHYLLTSSLLSLMEMCDKDSSQNKDEYIDQYMAKESDTKKDCVRELLYLAGNLNKLSEAKMDNMNDNKKQEQANDTVRHQAYSKEIRKADDVVGEKRTTDISQDTADVNTKSQFRKTKEIQSVNDSHVQTTDQATVHDNAVRGQKKENDRFEEASGGLPRIKEGQKNVFDGNSQKAITSVNDDENDYHTHANGTDIDKIYEATQAHYDAIGVNQTNDTDKKEDIETKHVDVDGLKDTELISANEETKQNVKFEAADKRRDKAAKEVTGRGRDIGQDIMMEKMNKTIDAAKAVAAGAEIGYQNDNKTDRYKTKMASEDDGQDINQDLVLPVETVYQLMVDTYNERRYKTKKKSRHKDRLQFEMDYHIDMDGKIIAAQLPENLHTLTDNEYTLPVVDDETVKRREKRNANSHAGKAGKNRKGDNGTRQRNSNLPEQNTGAKLKPNPRGSENENMTLAAVYCDDLVYISKTSKEPTANQTSSEVSEFVEKQRGTKERRSGAEGQAHSGNGKNQTKELVSESYSEQTPGSGNDRTMEAKVTSESYAEQASGGETGQTKEAELSSESYAEQTFDTIATGLGSQTAATSQRWHRKKKQKRKKAKWY